MKVSPTKIVLCQPGQETPVFMWDSGFFGNVGFDEGQSANQIRSRNQTFSRS